MVFIFSLMIIHCFQGQVYFVQQAGASNPSTEITNLLSRLTSIKTEDAIIPPSLEIRQEVRIKLTTIAEESPRGREVVIKALIDVVEDTNARSEWPIAYRWILAVNLLGDLRASEGIDALISNIIYTGENGIVTSIHYQPVVHALHSIGEPAIPYLIKALRNEDEEIRTQVRRTLVHMGRLAFPKLIEALKEEQTSIKTGAALVLAVIGGEDARRALEQEIQKEKDQEKRKELTNALNEYYRRWKNKN